MGGHSKGRSDETTAGGEFIAFWLRDGRVAADMNVNVWDVNEQIQPLIRSRRPVEAAALADECAAGS